MLACHRMQTRCRGLTDTTRGLARLWRTISPALKSHRWSRSPARWTTTNAASSSSASPSSAATSAPRPPYNVLFCGTDAFAARSLSALVARRSDLCPSLHILSPPDVTQSWGANRMKVSPVKQLAISHSLPHQEVPPCGMAEYQLPEKFDVGSSASILLTCSFGHLIPDTLLDRFPEPWQRLNIHPSLLPKLRGAAPIQWAIARQFPQSGVSIQSLEKGKFDTGRIFAQQAFPFPPQALRDGSFLEIEHHMADKAATLIVELLENLPHHVEHSWEQDENQKTFAPKIKAQHSVVNWAKMSAKNIVARHRAFSYLYQLNSTLVPATSTFPQVQTFFSCVFTVLSSELQQECTKAFSTLQNAEPGIAAYSPSLGAIVVKTLDSATQGYLAVTSLKVKGKREKSAKDWWNAYRDRAGPDGTLRFK